MSERKTEEEKINEKRSFLQKILGFRFTPSISAWKLAIALFLLIAIAYAVNGAGIIAKGDNLEVSGNATVQGKLEVSGNATVQGKIGIGTTIPARKLHIKDSAADNVLVVDSGDGITQRFSSVDLHDNGAAKWGIGKNPSGDFYIDQSSVGNTITILGSDRNVGIGTTNPAQKLDVAGQIHATGDICTDVNGKCLSTAGGGVGGGGGWTEDAAGNKIYTTNTGRNVGIGTTIPARKLHIKDSAADNVLVVDSGDGITQRFSSVDLHDNGAAKWGIGKNPSGDFYIDQSSVGNTITILGSDRNVGIGTTNPAQKLDVAGQIHATGDICTDVNGKCLSTAGGGVGGGGGWTEDAAGNKIYTTNTGRNVGI